MNGNLLINPQWCAGSAQTPQYYVLKGPVTYDSFCVSGSRTCSVTMTKTGATASCTCDVPIELCGQHSLMCGCVMRCIQCENCYLQVDFYDGNERAIESVKKDITCNIGADFSNQMACFPIPYNACSCKWSIQFRDAITACTFCAPFAYFC